MKNLFGRRYLGRAVLLFCLTASIALADVATLTLKAAPIYYGGEYTSPYTFLIKDSVGRSWTELLACLDLERRVGWEPRRYQVYPNSGPDWSAVAPPTPPDPAGSTELMYKAAAILTSRMLSSPANIQGQYAWAIWKIFQNSADLSVLGGDQGAVETLYTTALTDARDSTKVPTYTVYMPLSPNGSPNYAGQRFIGVPDGGVTLMLLGGVLVGLETLRRRLRA